MFINRRKVDGKQNTDQRVVVVVVVVIWQFGAKEISVVLRSNIVNVLLFKFFFVISAKFLDPPPPHPSKIQENKKLQIKFVNFFIYCRCIIQKKEKKKKLLLFFCTVVSIYLGSIYWADAKMISK